MSERTVELDYRVSEAMALESLSYPWRQRQLSWKTLVLWVAAFPIGLALGYLSDRLGHRLDAVSAVLGAIAVFEIWRFRHRKELRQAARRFSSNGNEHISAVFAPGRLRFRSDLADTTVSWRAVERIVASKSGTLIRLNGSTIPVPDAALPADLPPAEFREILTRMWKETP